MNAHFYSHPEAEMKGFSRRCQPRDFRRVHLSSQYIREESGGSMEEVIWLSHPGAGCQTWHSSFPNDYNMLNLLSSPPGRKFSKRNLTYISPPCSEFRKSSLSLSEGRTEIATPFSHAACCKRRACSPAYRAFPPIKRNYESKNLRSLEITQNALLSIQGHFFKALDEFLCRYWDNTLKQNVHINNQQAVQDRLGAFTMFTSAKVQSNTLLVWKSVTNVLQGFLWKSKFGQKNQKHSSTVNTTASTNNNSTQLHISTSQNNE